MKERTEGMIRLNNPNKTPQEDPIERKNVQLLIRTN